MQVAYSLWAGMAPDGLVCFANGGCALPAAPLTLARSGFLPVPDLSDFQAMPRPHPFPLPPPSCGQPLAGRTAP